MCVCVLYLCLCLFSSLCVCIYARACAFVRRLNRNKLLTVEKKVRGRVHAAMVLPCLNINALNMYLLTVE